MKFLLKDLNGEVAVRVVVAEWLRRWTRNPLGSPRAGSNPADYGTFRLLRHSQLRESSVSLDKLPAWLFMFDVVKPPRAPIAIPKWCSVKALA